MQLELTRSELEWLLFNLSERQVTLRKGADPLDMIEDETGNGLFEKLVELAKSEGLDLPHL